MKLTILGGGGIRFTFLTKSLAHNARRVSLTEVVSLGSSADNLAIFGEIARYTLSTIRPDIQFSITTDLVAVLQDTNYIVTTPRAGDNESRIHDEHIALRRGILGQEITGAGGFTMAMRSIPTTLRYCQLIEEYAVEDAILFNFTSPSGLVTEAIVRSGFRRRVYGICDASSELIRELPATLSCEERGLSMECYRLNHFSWFTHFTVRGGKVTERLIADPELYRKTVMQYLSPELVRLCDNQLLNEYLYYYCHQEVVLEVIQGAGETRGEQAARVSQEIYKTLCTVDTRTRPGAAFTTWTQHYLRRENSYMQNELQQKKFHTRGSLTLCQFIEEPDTGGYAGVTLDIPEAMNSITTKRIVISIQNHGILDFLRPDDVIEISCDLSRDGLEPVTPVKIPTVQKNTISYMKEYGRLAVAATLQRDKSLAVRALMAYPLIGSYSLARTLIGAYPDDGRLATWQ